MLSATPAFEAVIGIECHVQLALESKAFSPAPAAHPQLPSGALPNTLIDPYTLGLPGTLPVLNRRAVELAARVGLACGSTITRRSRFDRKHYFYPDLPKGYQITQQQSPICEGGALEYEYQSERKALRLRRIHLEEDAGKSLHDLGRGLSLIDYNRAGAALIELVSEPELGSGSEAAACLRALRRLVRFLGVSDGNMEEGSLRCDANVSLRRRGSPELGQKVELKNINSFRNLERAIDSEIRRQTELLAAGGAVVSETRGWDAELATSRSLRKKEALADYRYLPEPDLPELVVDEEWLAELLRTQPPTPLVLQDRYVTELGLALADAVILTGETELARYFNQMIESLGLHPPLDKDGQKLAGRCAAFLLSELQGLLGKSGATLAGCRVLARELAALARLVHHDEISGKQAKEALARMLETGEPARSVVAELGLGQLKDGAAIEAICRDVLFAKENEKALARARQNPQVLGFFVGKVLAATAGRAQPEQVSRTLERLLSDGDREPRT